MVGNITSLQGVFQCVEATVRVARVGLVYSTFSKAENIISMLLIK